MGRRPKTTEPARSSLLFLHGYTSNGLLFERKLAPLLRVLNVDAAFPSAPHRACAAWVEEAAEELGERGAARSWFRDEPAEGGLDDDGWADSLAAIRAAGPNGFDGIVAFSQGCRAALRLCTEPAYSSKVRFVVLCAAPDCSADVHTPLSVPSLHVFGLSDRLVPREASESTMRACTAGASPLSAAASVFVHEGAHAVPTSAEFARLLTGFVSASMPTTSVAAPAVLPASSDATAALSPAAALPAATCAEPFITKAARGPACTSPAASVSAPASSCAAAGASPPAHAAARTPAPVTQPPQPSPQTDAPAAALIGELEEEARAELDALAAILGEELLLGPDRDGPAGDSELDPSMAARLKVLLREDPPAADKGAGAGADAGNGCSHDGAVRLGADLFLQLLLPQHYPSRASLVGCARLLIEATPTASSGGSPLAPHFSRAFAAHLDSVARRSEGSVCAYECVVAAKDWVAQACDGDRGLDGGEDEETQLEAWSEVGEEEGGREAARSQQASSRRLGLPSRRRAGAERGGLPPALCASLAARPADVFGCKSCFFNAATATATAKVGAHPFTTIEPNSGVALVRVPAPTGAPVASVHVPVVLRDVAGLVPGACEGRGRGNRFLNDLCDADALVHVADASASADANGNLLVTQATPPAQPRAQPQPQPEAAGSAARARADAAGAGAEPVRAEGASSMREDVAWVHRELFRWVYDNVTASWEKVLRKPSHLFNLFTGYQCPPSLAEEALRICRPKPPPLESVAQWDEDDVASLVDAFLALRFATVICANKADLPAAHGHIAGLRAELSALAPGLAGSLVPASALCEGEVQRLERAGIVVREPLVLSPAPAAAAAAAGAAAAGSQEEEEAGESAAAEEQPRILVRVGGAQGAGGGAGSAGAGSGALAPRDAEALELAARCGYVLGAAPGGEDTGLAQLRPRTAPAVRVAGGVQATLQRAFWLRPPIVVFPVCDLLTARSYPLSEAALRDGGDPSADSAHVRDVVLMRPGSTVADLFVILLHQPYKLLGGEFVRAEGRPLHEPRAVRQLRKDEQLVQGCVIKFHSTRKGQRVKQ